MGSLFFAGLGVGWGVCVCGGGELDTTTERVQNLNTKIP